MLGYASATVHWVPLCLLYACRHSSRSHAYTETYTRATSARKGDKLIYRASSRCNNMQLFTGSAHTTLLIQVCMMLSLSLSLSLSGDTQVETGVHPTRLCELIIYK